jgi:hypothetical protein
MTATESKTRKHVIYEPITVGDDPLFCIVAFDGPNRMVWTGKNWSLNSSEALLLGKLCLVRDEMDYIENMGLM